VPIRSRTTDPGLHRRRGMARTIRRRGARALSAGALTLLIALTGACSKAPEKSTATSAPADTSKLISPASLTVGQPVAAPAGKPVFTVTGRITTANQRSTLVFDRPTLERLGVHQVRLYEPWTKENLDFRGVWLQDLVNVAGVQPGATKLHLIALDDFAVDLSLADIRTGGIMIATSTGDGSAIPIDKGGPTRIVFLNGVKAGVNPDQWLWSIKTIDVN
jgi:hypothetical protein